MHDPDVLPKKGRDRQEILRELETFGDKDPDYKQLKTWSLVYYLGEGHTRFLQEAYNSYFSANGLNPMAFQSLKRLENGVIRITADLLHGDRNVCGVMTSGGTESCLLAVKTYRDYGRSTRGITRPEMVIPETAHVAWFKGAEYFKVKPVVVPLDGGYRPNLRQLGKKVNRNTVMILGSAPEYPHGIIDPIEDLGAIAEERKVPLHVDACLGGYFLPFAEKLGQDIPPWDYRVPGVTSISADTHKYGFSAKGASTITYRSIDIMKYQFFVYENWPGGIFASPALLGTRPGGAYAAAWAALQSLGEEGYLAITAKALQAVQDLKNGISALPELEIIGHPRGSVFSYRSTASEVDIYAVGDRMEEKGWQIDRLQRPEALHAMVTPLHIEVVEQYLDDLKQAVDQVRRHPELSTRGGAAMYGMMAAIPFRGMVKRNVLRIFSGMYGPGGAMIDASSAVMEGDKGQEAISEDLAGRLARLYLKLKRRFCRCRG